jgi:hypothetical protein
MMNRLYPAITARDDEYITQNLELARRRMQRRTQERAIGRCSRSHAGSGAL